MYHIVTLSQSMLKEFRQAVYVSPSPAPEAGHVTSQQQNTPLALTKKNTHVHVGLLQLEVLFYNTDQLE